MRKWVGIWVLGFMIAASAAADPHAYPVPYVERDHASQGITFVDLPASGTIKIVTVSGEEVAKLEVPPPPAVKRWDVKNSSGKPVATGVYLFLVDGGGQQTSGKL